jgi:outer membrane protein assembly factor BamB
MDGSKLKKIFKIILIIVCVLAAISIAWTIFALIGRVDAGSIIPDSEVLRVSISNPARVIDGILAHESMHDISTVPALAPAAPILGMLNEAPVFKNKLARLAMRGKLEFALLSSDPKKRDFAAAFDTRLFSPLLRLLPGVSVLVNIGLIKIPGLSYVKDGVNSRFEYRVDDMTLFIGRHRNLLFTSNNFNVFTSRSEGNVKIFYHINPSAYDAALLISSEYIYDLFADQDPKIAATLDNIEFDSMVEAGVLISPKKLEFNLAAPLSSDQLALNNLLDQRSRAPYMSEYIPASTQYTTVLSAGTLEELYQAAVVFSGPELDDTLKMADSSARAILNLSIDELLFSWSGKEFAIFGMEGRPHPVFAIQVADERKRQEVFDKAFKSIFLNEDIRLNLDGVRMPRIAVPEFLQSLLRRWNIFIPSPYYTIYKDLVLVSESAETLLSALREIQRNDVLPKTAVWRNIAGGKASASAFSVYYSLDLSMPFFLRKNTTLSAFLSLYKQGHVILGFNRGVVNLSLSLVPGSGNGVTLVNGYPLDIGGRASRHVFGAGRGSNSRVFFASGSSAFSVDVADNTIHELDGQGTQWVVPAEGDKVFAWVVSDRGRVTLVDGNMEIADNFPVITGLRLSAPPQAFGGKVYLCDEDGKVHSVDEKGMQDIWETSFDTALRSPPSFLNVSVKNVTRNYAAVYPKSFFGEIWLLDADGRALPNWPVPVSLGEVSALGYGSPLLFAHNNSVYAAFITQTGELALYDENAAIISPFPLFLNGMFYLQPVFDGDYLLIISSEGTLHKVGLDGELLYQNIPGLSVKEEGYITVFDCDDDKIPEIFITGEGNALYAFTRNFRSMEGFPLPVWGRPLFISAQNTSGGKNAEIFGMGMDRKLYRWQFK